MNYFSHEKVTDAVTRIRDVSGVCMYLVEGMREAVLIDTGVGLGNLAFYVRELTDKPLTVLITHGHVDHAMGTGCFERVYISPADRDIYRIHSDIAVRKDYLAGSAVSGGDPEALGQAADTDWMNPLPWESFLPLQVGDIFDLGGKTLEICPGAGHTPGCITILLEEEKILFLGDAANSFTFLFDMTGQGCCLTLAEYRSNLCRLLETAGGRYDRCMFFHGPGDGPVDTVESVIAVIDDIMAGKDDRIPFAAMGMEGLYLAKAIDFSRMCRVDGGSGNLVYDPALK